MAILTPWPTIEDFRSNDEDEDAGVSSEEDIQELLEENGLLGLALEYRAAAEAIVRWIHSEQDNEHTNQDYRSALRSFGKYRLKLDDPPESLAWISTTTSNDFNPVPSERDLLLWNEDVMPMIDAARNPRDKALFAVQFEAGCRSGELYDLRVRDVFDSDHSVGLHVNGKRGERTVHLIDSVPYLNRWLIDHPGDNDDYLWSKLDAPERPSYNTWIGYFKDAAARAGISKEVTPTKFRKSNTRWLVNQGMPQPRIEDRQGRKRGSEHTRRYLARFGKESNEREYVRLRGVDVETEEPEEIGPKECPRCGQDTPREGDRCMWCGFALSHRAAREAEEKQRAALDSVPELLADERVDPQDATETLNDLISRKVQAALEQHYS
jgi:integrase